MTDPVRDENLCNSPQAQASDCPCCGGDNHIELSILRLVARHSKVPIELLLNPKRGTHHVSLARQLAMYLMHVSARRTMVEIGEFLGRDRSTVSHACGRVEDLRDCEDFDNAVSDLEQTIAQALYPVDHFGGDTYGHA